MSAIHAAAEQQFDAELVTYLLEEAGATETPGAHQLVAVDSFLRQRFADIISQKSSRGTDND